MSLRIVLGFVSATCLVLAFLTGLLPNEDTMKGNVLFALLVIGIASLMATIFIPKQKG